MKRIAVLVLLFLAFAVAEDISLNRAATIAAVEYPGLASTQPQSIPTYHAVTEEGSYWIVEFDNVWVPVTTDGTLLQEEQNEIVKAYTVHYALQKIIDQRDGDQYPVNKDTSLTLLLGDVESKESYLVSYKTQLPTSLQNDEQKLIDSAKSLKTAIQTSINSINAVRARENNILFNAANYSDFEAWRSDFTSMLDAFDSVATKGYAYDDARTEFNLAAQDFVNQSDDTNEKQLVQAFTSGIGISNIPGSLPGLESTVHQWKTWTTSLTNEKNLENAESIYIIYREYYSGENVFTLGEDAYEKVQTLSLTVPIVLNDLYSCQNELSPKEQTELESLNSTYLKATNSYNQGVKYGKELDDTNAKESYLNAISWAEDAEELKQKLIDVQCPRVTSTPIPSGNIFMDFITSTMGLVFIGLVVVLVVLYWWNNRKQGGENYEQTEYVPDW